MSIDKPDIGEPGWGTILNAALDDLDARETVGGAQSKATAAYIAAAEYADTVINDIELTAGPRGDPGYPGPPGNDGAPGSPGIVDDSTLAARINDDGSESEAAVDARVAAGITGKAPIDSPTFTGTVAGVTKTHVGLANVDNTSDANKPVSTAGQTALNLKANLASPTFTGTVAGVTKTHVGLGSVDNTADTAKPVSTLQAAADAVVLAASAQKASNLSDLANAETAKENLALGAYSKALPLLSSIANRRKAAVDIVVLGDSQVEGYSLSAMADTMPIQLAEALRAKYPVRGVVGGRGYIGVQNDLTNQAFWPDAYTGAIINTNLFAAGYGPNRRHFVMTSAAQKVVRTVPAEGLTSFDIHVLKGTGSPFLYYKIGAGAAVPLSTSNATLIAGVLHVAAAVPGGSTIEVGWSSGGSVYYCGITEYNGDENAGIRVHNLGQSGSTVALWRSSIFVTGQWLQSLQYFTPKALIIPIGGNDARTAGGNISAATFGSTMTAWIAEFRTASYYTGPIILSMMYNLSSTNSGLVEAWANYVTAAKAIAAADATVLVVDHNARMPAWNIDGYSLYNSGSSPHATAKGYAAMVETDIALAMSFR